jgi:hypothetical protein
MMHLWRFGSRRPEVPCCGGIEQAAAAALKNSGKSMPWRLVTLGIDGEIRDGA